jgi:hypothetical protein
MAVADVHPSVEELTAFIRGTLDEETQASIEAHVAACTSCQERAAVAPDDSFVELVRSVQAAMVRGADTVLVAGAQSQTPVPPEAVVKTDAILPAVALSAPAESDRPEVPEALLPELVHHERYRVVRLLGVGGMGAVYEAEHRVLHRPVALKVIKRAYTASPAALDRFRREVRAAACLSHPNIVTTHDAEESQAPLPDASRGRLGAGAVYSCDRYCSRAQAPTTSRSDGYRSDGCSQKEARRGSMAA